MCSLPSNSLWSREGVRGVEKGTEGNIWTPSCRTVLSVNRTAMGS